MSKYCARACLEHVNKFDHLMSCKISGAGFPNFEFNYEQIRVYSFDVETLRECRVILTAETSLECNRTVFPFGCCVCICDRNERVSIVHLFIPAFCLHIFKEGIFSVPGVSACQQASRACCFVFRSDADVDIDFVCGPLHMCMGHQLFHTNLDLCWFFIAVQITVHTMEVWGTNNRDSGVCCSRPWSRTTKSEDQGLIKITFFCRSGATDPRPAVHNTKKEFDWSLCWTSLWAVTDLIHHLTCYQTKTTNVILWGRPQSWLNWDASWIVEIFWETLHTFQASKQTNQTCCSPVRYPERMGRLHGMCDISAQPVVFATQLHEKKTNKNSRVLKFQFPFVGLRPQNCQLSFRMTLSSIQENTTQPCCGPGSLPRKWTGAPEFWNSWVTFHTFLATRQTKWTNKQTNKWTDKKPNTYEVIRNLSKPQQSCSEADWLFTNFGESPQIPSTGLNW